MLNLEGVLLPDMPESLPHLKLGMPARLATDWLTHIGTVAVGLANNHVTDFGHSGIVETQRALRTAGITGIVSGERFQHPGFSITVLSDFQNSKHDELTMADLDQLVVADPARANIAFLHWGHEFETTPGPRETTLAQAMRDRGVSIILGTHPHRASTGLRLFGNAETLMLYSLGNFFFDQTAEVATGALAELTIFPQGTVFLRQHPLVNLFDIARAAKPANHEGENKTK